MVLLLVGIAMTWLMSRRAMRRGLLAPVGARDRVGRLRRSRGIPMRMTAVFGVAGAVELLSELPALRPLWWIAGAGVLFLFRIVATVIWLDCFVRARAKVATPFDADAHFMAVLRHDTVRLAASFSWLAVLGYLIAQDPETSSWMFAFPAYVFLTGVAQPLILRLAVATRRPTDDERERIESLSRRYRLRIGAVRVIAARADRGCNAMAAGLLPGVKNIFVTEQLLETLEDDELAAVLAHEVAHRDQHHVAVDVAIIVATSFALCGLVAGTFAAVHLDDVDSLTLSLAVLIGLPPTRLLAVGAVRLRHEHRADAFAAARVGALPMQRALVKLTAHNQTPVRSSWLRSLRVGHPSVHARLERLLHASEPAATPAG